MGLSRVSGVVAVVASVGQSGVRHRLPPKGGLPGAATERSHLIIKKMFFILVIAVKSTLTRNISKKRKEA